MLIDLTGQSFDHLFCVKIVHRGNWTNPVFELFAETPDGVPTHIHIYRLPEFKEGLRSKKFTLPVTLKTCSRDPV